MGSCRAVRELSSVRTQRAGSRERTEAPEAGDACTHLEDVFTVERELTNVVKQLCCCCCSVAELCLPLCDSSILHYLLEFAQIYALKQLYSNKKK